MVDNKYNIELDGLGYVLARQPRTKRPIYKRSEAPSFVNKFGSGDPSYRDATFWSHWVQINWQNGSRSEFFNDEARYLYSSNINIHEEGRLSLAAKFEDPGTAPSAGSVGAVCAVTDSWWGSNDYRLWVGNGLGGLYEANSSVSAWTEKYVIGNPPVTALMDGDSSIWVGSGLGSADTSQGILYRISANGTFQSSANLTNDGINVLYTSDFDGTTRQYIGTTRYDSLGGQVAKTTNDVSAFTTIWSSSRGKVTDIVEYSNLLVMAAGYPKGNLTTPYNGIVVVYNGVNTNDLVRIPHTVPLCLTVFDNLLFVGTAHGHLYVYNGSSFDLLFKFWGNDIDMKIVKLWVHQDKLYILVSQDSNLKNSQVKYAGVWTFNRRGVNLEYKQDSDTTSAYVIPYTYKNQFLFSYGAAGKLVKINENLFQVSGSLQSSYFDANLPSLDKLNKEVVVLYDYLSASTSASIGFKYDETESFTSLGTIQTEGTTSATFQFPSATSEKKASYQITLSTGNVSATPRIKKIITKYTIQPDFYHRWDFGIDTSEKTQLLDGTFHPSAGLELESALFTSKRQKQLVSFKDVDYVSTTLNGAIAASATIINVGDASRMPPKGRLRIPSTGEEIIFGSRTSTTLNSVTRGYKNTTATSAANAATIDMSYQAIFTSMSEEQFSLNQLADDYNHITPVSLLEA